VLKITLNPNHPSIPGSYEDRIAANVNPYGVVVGMLALSTIVITELK